MTPLNSHANFVKHYYNIIPTFPGREVKVQEGLVTCPRSHCFLSKYLLLGQGGIKSCSAFLLT